MGSVLCFCKFSESQNHPNSSFFVTMTDNVQPPSFNDLSLIERSAVITKHKHKIPAIRILKEKIKHPSKYHPEEKVQLVFTRSKQPLDLKEFKIAKFLGFTPTAKTLLVMRSDEDKPEYRVYCLKIMNKDIKITFDILKAVSFQGSPFLSHTKAIYLGNEKVYFVNEFVSGGSFLSLMGKHGFYSETLISFILAEVILAYEYLHITIGIPCGNLKANNVHLTSKGHICLIDYGVYKKDITKNLSIDDVLFAAPEVLEGSQKDFLTDFWSLGIFFALILKGTYPFEDPFDYRKVEKEIKSNKMKLPTDISAMAKDLLEGLLSHDRSKRLGKNGIEEVKKHKFFAIVNWDLLRSMKLQSPFVAKGKVEKVSDDNKRSSINNEKLEDLGETAIVSSIVHFMK